MLKTHHTAEWVGLPAGLRARVVREAATFAAGFAPWTHFATLVFVATVSRSHAERARHGFLRQGLAVAGGLGHVPFAVAEGLQASGRPHLHVLLSAPGVAAEGPVQRAWRHVAGRRGNAQVTPLADAAAAGVYLVRHDAWDLGVACPRDPRCRRTPVGCVEFARLAARSR